MTHSDFKQQQAIVVTPYQPQMANMASGTPIPKYPA